jgi:ABC-type Fe3+/spermidine/putrescine transport system ATPase subunit
VATFVGENNEFRGLITRLEDDRAIFTISGKEIYSPLDPRMRVGDGVVNYVRPERMRLLPADGAQEPDGPVNLLAGQIQDVVFDGAVARTFIDLSIGQQVVVMVTRASDVPLPRRGENVRVGWNLEDVTCFPVER